MDISIFSANGGAASGPHTRLLCAGLRLLHGEGFHARTKIKKSKKVYSRERKHREELG